MIPFNFRPVTPGPLTQEDAASINAVMDLLRRLANLSVTPPLLMSDSAGGIQLSMNFEAGSSVICKSPSGGIPGASQPTSSDPYSVVYASCVVYLIQDDGVGGYEIVETERSIDVWNALLDDIAPSTFLIATLNEDGKWLAAESGSNQTWVQISSVVTDVEGHYTGTSYAWLESSHTWVTKDTIKVEPANGEILALGIKYPAVFVGMDVYGTGTNGSPVYKVYPGKSEVVKVTGPAVAGVYPAVLQKYNAGTWVDAEAVDVIEINGANLSGWSGGIYSWGSH